MKYFQIIFSPTGETEKAANAITQCWGQVETIDLSVANKDFSAIALNFTVMQAKIRFFSYFCF